MLVTKIGGSIAEDADPVLDEIAEEAEPVLVHGFGPQTTRQARQQNLETRWIRSPEGVRSRFTDEAMLSAMQTAADRVAQSLADELAARQIPHRRIAGHQRLIEAEAKPALRHQREDGRVLLVRGNRSGRVTRVDAEPLSRALANDEVPIVTPLARDEEGLLSVDADRAAAAIAGELGVDELVLLTDVDRVLDEDGNAIEELTPEGIARLHDAGALEGGMLRKAIAAREALEAGVEQVWIANGRRADPIERARRGHATEASHP